ncbi:MAG: GreA/GreB family elongation factor [Candidatus Shapirobacteria bacterium]|nr:GreA/GreB family elongation factor [Candidatus Shapirobacteria bacterium]MDD4410602.1 GreA/GreB family elongation factor [Candidatus Shapirobacteria bacterium]
MSQKNLLTQEGYNSLVEQLNDLKKKQEHLISQIEDVAQPDESGEDGLATQLKEELEVVNDKIDSLESALEDVSIINGDCKRNQVEVGCTVKIKISDNSIKQFSIVTNLEADPNVNKISDQSPLGVALLGKKINDKVEVSAPAGKITYKIVSIC